MLHFFYDFFFFYEKIYENLFNPQILFYGFNAFIRRFFEKSGV